MEALVHENVRRFVDELHENPPADLAAWLRESAERPEAHRREFDLNDLRDSKHVRRVEDAEKVLPELVRLAQLGRTMTFSDFVAFVGRGNKRTTNGSAINPIVAMCLTHGLPPLWTLVVSASTGLGSGYWREHTDEQKIARQGECFAHYGANRAGPLPSARTARRRPIAHVRDACPTCNMERTPSGACDC